MDDTALNARMYANDANGVNVENGRGISDEVKDGEMASGSEDGAEQTVLGQAGGKTGATRIPSDG